MEENREKSRATIIDPFLLRKTKKNMWEWDITTICEKLKP